MQASIGRKVGMTRVFDDAGRQIPVTVVEVGPCVVLQRKTADADGYEAVQIGYLDQKAHRVSKAHAGHVAKAETGPKRFIREFRVDAASELKAGDEVGAANFDGVTAVDVTAVTKGRGFAGVIKRHNMHRGRMTHGGHSKRRPGAIGCSSYPANVMKGKAMPGHYGNVKVTVQNLKVVGVRPDDNVILLRGAVPGPNGGTVVVRRSIKQKTVAS